MILHWCTHHYIFLKARGMYSMEVNPDVKKGLWVMVMSPCRLIHCNRGATLVGDIDEKIVHVWVREYLGTLYFLNFAVN